jgi:hypothetical protein
MLMAIAYIITVGAVSFNILHWMDGFLSFTVIFKIVDTLL